MTPGQVYPIEVAAFPTSNLFKRGHRIRGCTGMSIEIDRMAALAHLDHRGATR